jgi:hypothetical protein
MHEWYCSPILNCHYPENGAQWCYEVFRKKFKEKGKEILQATWPRKQLPVNGFVAPRLSRSTRARQEPEKGGNALHQ